jgi:hypothetical protein
MWLSPLLPKLSPNRGSKPRAGHRLTTRFRPRLEALEDRCVPSKSKNRSQFIYCL